MNKKQWQKPELQVLVRSNPEEAVLTNCKFDISGSGGNSPAVNFRGCSLAGCDSDCLALGAS